MDTNTSTLSFIFPTKEIKSTIFIDYKIRVVAEETQYKGIDIVEYFLVQSFFKDLDMYLNRVAETTLWYKRVIVTIPHAISVRCVYDLPDFDKYLVNQDVKTFLLRQYVCDQLRLKLEGRKTIKNLEYYVLDCSTITSFRALLDETHILVADETLNFDIRMVRMFDTIIEFELEKTKRRED
jgi:hypothetical protein